MNNKNTKYRCFFLNHGFLIGWVIIPLLFLFTSCDDTKDNYPVYISADTENIEMGRSVIVSASVRNFNGEKSLILLPFINGSRWGSHEFTDENGNAEFIIPLPNPGPAILQVIAVKPETDTWLGLKDSDPLLKTGTYMPDSEMKSNQLILTVNYTEVIRPDNGNSLFGVQFETWFTPGKSWLTSQGIPLTGIYDSTDPDVYRQQILWFIELGVDFIIPDWSNHMWGKEHWDERSGFADGILHTTQILLEVLADMRDEGLKVPKVALMPGLSNGPPTTMEGLNEQLNWIFQDYVRNPRFHGLWQLYDGKPLIIILDTGIMAQKEGTTESAFRVPFFKETLTAGGIFNEQSLDSLRKRMGPVDTSRFTLRWMSSQNQVTGHDEFGYWSWMDGSLKPVVTYRNGEPEAITVTPAFFAEYGWTAPEAYGRRGGWTYIESFREAIQHKPRVVMLHQWNEYTGQLKGQGRGPERNIYTDTYSIELSDDLEPISPSRPGYRGEEPYGFYYLNLTRALMDIFRGQPDDVTVLAGDIIESGNNTIKIIWTTAGVVPDSYTISLDGKKILENTNNKEYTLSTGDLSSGEHIIRITANGVGTLYPLSLTQFDIKSNERLPVFIEEIFKVN